MLLSGISLVYLGQNRIDEDIERLKSEERSAVRLGTASLASDLTVTLRHLKSLTQEKPILATLNAPIPSNIERMIDAFTSLILRNPSYAKVRWIDETGMEVVRINSEDGKPVTVPQSELQSKANRYFFTDAMKLKPGEIYLSRPDLNMEHGQIELPKRLMLRVATPVMDSSGRPRGIFIINLQMRRLFESFIGAVDLAAPHMMVLNNQGVWLRSPSPSDEIEFIGESKVTTFGQRFPEAWERIVKNEAGSFFSDDGLWVWQKATPIIAQTVATVKTEESPWIVVSHVTAAGVHAIKTEVWSQLAPVALMGTAILATICWLVVSGKTPVRVPPSTVIVDSAEPRHQWVIYVLAVLLPIAMAYLRQMLPESYGDRPLLMLFLFPIILNALLGGIGPGLMATAVAALCSNYWLIPPYESVQIASGYDLFQWSLLIANGMLISVLSEGLRRARCESERRRLQQTEMMEQVLESEARFRQLAEQTRDIFWIHSWPDGRLSYVSPAFETMTGISIENMYEDIAAWPNAIHPADREWARLAFREGVDAGHFNLQYRLIHTDGGIRWVEDIGTSVRDTEGRIYRVVGIVRDITERKQAELQLQASAQRLQSVVRAGKVGLWEWNLQSDQVLYSPEWKAQIGFDENEIADNFEEWRSRVHPDDLERILKSIQYCLAAPWTDFQVEFRLRHKDGSYRWIFSQASLLKDEQGKSQFMMGSHIDITEQKRTEEALHDSELRMRQAQDAAHAGSWEWILENDINYWSENLWALYGLDPTQCEPSYAAWLGAVKMEDQEQVTLTIAAAVAEGSEIELQWRVNVPKDVPERWLLARGRPIKGLDGKTERYIGIAIDITDSKRMEEELEQHRHHLEELVLQRTKELQEANHILEVRSAEISDLYNNAPCGYHSLNAEGLIVAINDTELSWLGYQREEVVSRLTFGQIITTDSLHIFKENFPRFKETGQIRDLEVELLSKDGSVLPVSINATAVYDEDGRYQFSRSTLFDFSERKAKNLHIAKLNTELAQRVEEAEAATLAKSAFLANMSHEIRTPMNAVLGFCYLLQQRQLEGETLALIRKINAAGQALMSLINDILDFSKIEAGRLDIENKPFRLTGLLDNLASIMMAAHDKDLELVITPLVDIDALIGDIFRIQQVLINLLGNAIKFTTRGEVELRLTVESSDEWQVNLRFAVRDTGIGITSEQQALIFSAFSQADGGISRRFGGTGLGLAISRQLVEAMGGNLQVKSEFGQGSEFWFVLPLQRDLQEELIPFQLSRLEILVADDSSTVREALAMAARSLGWKVDVADSGEAALKQALARGDDECFYDALLFDWKMPGLDGLDAAKAIRQALKEKKKSFKDWPIVIMVTSYSHDELVAQPGMAWVDQVISKPVTPSALYNAVYDAMRLRQQGVSPVPLTKLETTHLRRIPGVRVLVVDDSEINLELAQGILEGDGAVVNVVKDGQEALEWLQAHPNEVDIILMDVQMPRLDGYAATRRIRENDRWKNLPIIALTAGAFQALRDAAQESGMNDFIPKPFNVEQMMGTIQRWTGCRPETQSFRVTDMVETDGVSPILAVELDTPTLPHIDLPEALRIWGQVEVYRNYLDKFVLTYAQAGEEIVNSCRQGDLAAAAAQAHKLCGVAGTLRLPNVAELARKLETQLNNNDSAYELAAKLQVAIDQVCASIAGWKVTDSPSAINEPTIHSNLDDLDPLFRGLLVALDRNDPDETKFWLSKLRQRLDDPRLAEVQALLTDFDFNGAKALVLSLQHNLNLSIRE
jgi:PAS domain S-box-containing protein